MNPQAANVKSRPANFGGTALGKSSGWEESDQVAGGDHDVEHAAGEQEINDGQNHGMSGLGVV